MKSKLMCVVLAVIVTLGSFGCTSQYRQAAVAALKESQRIERESTYDMYQIIVRKVLSSVKARLQLANGHLDEKVVVVDRKGVSHTVTMLDKVVNEEVQALVDAAWLYKNTAEAEGLSDQALIFILSREGFIEVLGKDIKAAFGAASGKNAPSVTTQPG